MGSIGQTFVVVCIRSASWESSDEGAFPSRDYDSTRDDPVQGAIIKTHFSAVDANYVLDVRRIRSLQTSGVYLFNSSGTKILDQGIAT